MKIEEIENNDDFYTAEATGSSKGCFLDEDSWSVRDITRAKRFESEKECLEWINTLTEGCKKIFIPAKHTQKELKNGNKPWYECV